LELVKVVVVLVQQVEVLGSELELWEGLALVSVAWKPLVPGVLSRLLQESLERVNLN
jgi:hypothetical protein